MFELLRSIPTWVSLTALGGISVLCALAPSFMIAVAIALGALAIFLACIWLYHVRTRGSPQAGPDAALHVRSIKCPRCDWSGTVRQAQTETVEGRKEVFCPRCDRRLQCGE